MHMIGGKAGDVRLPIARVIGQVRSVAAEYLRIDPQAALGGGETRDDPRGTPLFRGDGLDYVQYSQHPLTERLAAVERPSPRSMICVSG